MDNATIWNIIDTYFEDNPQCLVQHHIDSYNDFYKNGIYQIFKEKNPISIYSRLNPDTNEYDSICKLYMGGKDGSKIYFGKPVIHDKDHIHYMYPNEARLRNMNYSMTIHYDIDVEFTDKLLPGEMPTVIGAELIKEAKDGNVTIENFEEDEIEEKKALNEEIDQDIEQEAKKEGGGKEGKKKEGGPGTPKQTERKKIKKDDVRFEMTVKAAANLREVSESNISGNTQSRIHTLEKIYLGKFPIMIQSDFCILNGLSKEIRHSLGECRNDLGGYFIIDGKEKTIVAQEKFADNMLYIKKVDDDKFYYSAEMRCVSENASKPVRTFSVKMCKPSKSYTNKQIVVNIPNVRAPVPLFIVFRALGIISDKSIISYCLLDLEKYSSFVDLFIPSVHDAANILSQQNALKYIALLTKGKGISHALEILTDFFLPHVGETNYIAKAYALGDIVFRLLSVYTGSEQPTDRDNFKYKRVELVGSLLYDLFREYWTIQLKSIHLEFEKKLYYNQELYENNLFGLITQNYKDIFREKELERGFKKAYKGNWGAYAHTKRIGAVQDLNRLSFNSALNHLRKTNLPLDSSAKVVGPRVLHNSHWGYVDPIDTPDGGNIGLHKHLAISTYITRGVSREPMIAWLREKWAMKLVEEFDPLSFSKVTKVIINGFMVGGVEEPIQCVQTFRLYRRNALVPIYASATFDIQLNTIFVYTDAGRLCRPIFYKDDLLKTISYDSTSLLKKLQNKEFSWTELTTGFNKKRETVDFDPVEMKIYELYELYEGVESETNPAKLERFIQNKAIIDYIDSSESEHALIALDTETFDKESNYTHCEIHNSLIFGMMCNMIIFPENNPATRNSFSCGQSKQACSAYHSNFQVRMDKTAVLLNYGQTPLLKSRFLKHITNEENAYGENLIVAIACYTGYNVEDAVLINEASIKRGCFLTSYISCYEAHEETETTSDVVVEKKFMNIYSNPNITRTKFGTDYSKLDEHGLIKEGTIVNDETAVIGLATVVSPIPGTTLNPTSTFVDNSKFPKKGQLGIVDKSFITDDEDGKRIAKIRIFEQRIPKIGDKIASRAGQKGTIGMVIPERDMPFTKDGIRPDIIVNPHAIPSRMTIGQLVECITGKACAIMGGFGDCTAFNNKGSKIGVFGEMLTSQGFHVSGNELLYNGMTGEQIEAGIFMGPTYYMRLKHMVKDKVNSRSDGPRSALTKQPVGGRANDGGLRIGEMERDTVISHGMNEFLRESMMERGDKYFLAVCNKTGMISIYNPSKNLFMSPMVDGPIQYSGSVENEDLRIQNVTKHGRSFSVVSIPYSMKLLIQEMQSINIQMRIITEDNIEQMEAMSYSSNMRKLTNDEVKNTDQLISSIRQLLREKQQKRIETPSDKLSVEELAAFSKNDRVQYLKDVKPNRLWIVQGVSQDNNVSIETTDMENSAPLESMATLLSKDETKMVLSVFGDELSLYVEEESPEWKPPATPEDYESPEVDPNSPLYPSPPYPDDLQPMSPTPPQPVVEPRRSQRLQALPPENGQLGGGSNTYKVGGRVCMRDYKDNYPARPWEIAHMGPKFITVKAIDKTGLNDNESTKVVLPYDIYPETEAQLLHRPELPVMNSPLPMPGYGTPQAQAPVIIAPKFFNGDGSDNSTSELPNAAPVTATPVENTNVVENTPNIVVKDSVIAQKPESKENKELDFSNLVIKKVG